MASWAWGLWSSELLPIHHALILSISCFFVFFLLRRLKKKSDGLPTNWPIIGMAMTLIMHFHRFYDLGTGVLRAADCIFFFKGPWFCFMDYLVTTNPADVSHILSANFTNYPKGHEYSEIFDILGDGIFNVDHDSWRSQRKKAQALMTHRRFRVFVEEYSREKVRNALIPLLDLFAEEGRVVDLQDVFVRFTFDATCKLVFGEDPGCLSPDFPTVPFAKAMEDAMEAVAFRYLLPRFWWKMLRWMNSGTEKKLASARRVMDHFARVSIDRKKKESKPESSSDLLASYIAQEDDEKYLRDTTINLMLAGRDTTGTALAWFFYLLAKNPDVEEKILQELKAESQEKEEESVYLHAALCESLRLYPPVPFEQKVALKPETLPSGVKVRAGTRILMSAYWMGRMEGVWGMDCEQFRPERWISEKGKVKHEPSYKFFAFNSGRRACLGKDMAFTQMKAVAAAMIKKFRVGLEDEDAVKPKLSVILLMRNGLKVTIKKRE